MYQLKMHAYCGMGYEVATGTLAECRARAGRWRKRHANEYGGEVSTLRRGFEWELVTPDDALMVSDQDGILEICKLAEEAA
jgi:hypothetical protein